MAFAAETYEFLSVPSLVDAAWYRTTILRSPWAIKNKSVVDCFLFIQNIGCIMFHTGLQHFVAAKCGHNSFFVSVCCKGIIPYWIKQWHLCDLCYNRFFVNHWEGVIPSSVCHEHGWKIWYNRTLQSKDTVVQTTYDRIVQFITLPSINGVIPFVTIVTHKWITFCTVIVTSRYVFGMVFIILSTKALCYGVSKKLSAPLEQAFKIRLPRVKTIHCEFLNALHNPFWGHRTHRQQRVLRGYMKDIPNSAFIYSRSKININNNVSTSPRFCWVVGTHKTPYSETDKKATNN